jgi:hypothetical protein
MPDETQAEKPHEDSTSRGRPSLRGLARRILRDSDPAADSDEDGRHSESSMARDVLVAALATGDKARMELIRLVAREVRGYLEAMELHKDLHHLMTNYSFEVHASVSLKPLEEEEQGKPSASFGLKKKKS